MKLTLEEKLIREYLIEIAKKNKYTVYSELCDEIWNRCTKAVGCAAYPGAWV